MSEPQITVQAAHVSPGSNLPVRRIVIHSTCPDVGYPAASKPGSASGTAKYFSMASSGGSAHYVEGIDREEHCVADAAIAWHAPPNPNSIGIEITSDGGDASAFKVASHAYTRDQWLSPLVLPILERAAARVAELCDRHGVPKVRLSAAQVQAGAKGICGHVDVTNAFHQSSHTDPGPAFPWDTFMALVTSGSAPAPEDDPLAAFTESDLEHAAGVGVHNQEVGASGLTIGVILQRLYNSEVSQGAQIAALTAAVNSLAAGTGDPAAVTAAIDTAMKKWSFTPTKGA